MVLVVRRTERASSDIRSLSVVHSQLEDFVTDGQSMSFIDQPC